MLHSYHTLKRAFFQEKTAVSNESELVNVCLPFPILLCYTVSMTDLSNRILQQANGENRLHPDEQRTYLGTFRERVILLVSLEESTDSSVKEQFDFLCQTLASQHTPLYLKISPKLPDGLQIFFMKVAQMHNISCSIIDEKTAHSPYALVFHSDQALDLLDVSLEYQFPNTIVSPSKTSLPLPFWKKWWKSARD